MRKHSVPLAQAFSTNFTSSTRSFVYSYMPFVLYIYRETGTAKQKRFGKVSPEQQQQQQEQEQEQQEQQLLNS